MRSFTVADLLYPEEANGCDGFMIKGELVKFLQFSANVAGSTVLLAGTAGKRYRVHALTMGTATSAVAFGLAASGSVIFGLFNPVSNQVLTWPFNPAGWCQTDYSQALNAYETAAAVVNGVLIYTEIP